MATAVRDVQNTLRYEARRCINCEMCLQVCPHGAFEGGLRQVKLVRPEACMECGACQRNCPTGAIQVDSGTGCATAMIRGALRRANPFARRPKAGTQTPACGET